MDLSIEFDNPYFDDMPPDTKQQEELIHEILAETCGRKVSTRKYSENEKNMAARKLILNGFIRGTIFDRYHCSWNSLTRKGRFLMELLEKKTYEVVH